MKGDTALKFFVIFFCLPIGCKGFLHCHPTNFSAQKSFVSSFQESKLNYDDLKYTLPSQDENIQIAGRNLFEHVSILDNSLKKLTGKGLCERVGCDEDTCNGEDYENKIYKELCLNDRFVIVSHGTEDDPIYNFSNVAGLFAFVRSWDDFIKLPSRLSVVLQSKDEKLRVELMSKVTNDGYVEGATGIRVRGDGQFIKLVDAVVWNLYDSNDVYVGQAAMFDREICPIISSVED